ncbi:MAG: DMT family transporter [Alphaproteobacteria bacterium]|nr:DMT family transporter [Alphaproteobacteria bacterium]
MSEYSSFRTLYASLFLFFGMAFFGSGTPVSKMVGEAFPFMFASGIRMGLAAALLIPAALFTTQKLFKLSRQDWLHVFVVALIGNVVFSLFMLNGMSMVSGVVGAIVMSTTPAVTAFASVIFLKESMNARKLFALILSLGGVVVINLASGKGGGDTGMMTQVLGSLLVFGAVCSEATYTLMGKVTMKTMPPLKLAGLSALLATIMFLPFVIWQAGSVDISSVEAQGWGALAWWGLGTMALGSLLWFNGVEQVPGHISAVFMAIMPVSALVLSYVLLDEAFEWMHLAGFGLTFAGVLVVIYEHWKSMKSSREESGG